MIKHRALLGCVTALMLLALTAPSWGQQQPQPVKPSGPKAGAITALLPTAHILRGTGKQTVDNPAKKGDDLYWNDTVKTDKGGRARITLADQSILSLGSQAQLKIVKHDAKTQETALQLEYGRLRAEVSSITRSGGSFEVRTPTAVAGVIGTDFGTDSGIGDTTFLCISGSVSVGNSDTKIPGKVQCTPGQTTTVSTGKAPTTPTAASAAQIQQFIQDTLPANISSLSPASALIGATANVTLNGSKLTGIQTVAVSGAGITGTPLPGATDTQAGIHLVIGNNAQAGPHTITLTKTGGAQSAAVFTVLAPPSATSGDPKKAYHDLITQEDAAAKAGLSGVLATVQQTSDQAQQALNQGNSGLPQPIDLTQATNGLAAQVTAVKSAIDAAGGQDDQAAAGATAAFDAAFQTAQNALLGRNPTGTPDDAFNTALKTAFDQINGQMLASFDGNQKNLNTLVQTASANIAQLEQNWLQQIATAAALQQTGPAVAVNGSERSIDVGASFGGGSSIASLDASRTKPLGNTTILGYSWVLCDPSYKPQQFGIPIPANTPGCTAVPGYTSSTSEFAFPTCNLAPADYIARVTATDSNNKKTAMDVKIHVLAPTYDDPVTRIRNLANAYIGLQPTQFMGFFDDSNYPGYTVLSENIRNTFPTLNSMIINVIVSQNTIVCNDATVRADWDQNYTFKSNPTIQVEQREQLSARMSRVPGKGWFIVDFSGDNGTVQGLPPGPIVSSAAQPNLVISSLAFSSGSLVSPGSASFNAVFSNTGSLDAPATTAVISLVNSSGATVTTVNVNVPALPAGSTVTVPGTLTVPPTTGVSLTLAGTVNPNCGSTGIGESNCSDNTSASPITVGTPFAKYVITNFVFQGHGPGPNFTGANAVQVGENLTGIATITNVGGLTLSGTITVQAVCTPAPPCDVNGGNGAIQTVNAPAGNSSVQVVFPFRNFNMPPGTYTGIATITAAPAGADLSNASASIIFEGADFQITAGPSFSPNAQNMLIGGSPQITSQITEAGNPTTFPIAVSVDAIAPGVFTSIPNPLQNPGTQNITVSPTLSTAPGPGTLTLRGTNHGVSKTSVVPVNFYSATITPTTLFVNDIANPLILDIGSANPYDLSLKLVATNFQAAANLVPPAPVGALTSNVNPVTAAANDLFDLLVTAGAGSSPVTTPLTLKAQIPFTNPQDSISYTLFVVPKNIPDLKIAAINPPGGFVAPAVNGQGLDLQVTVANSASAGTSLGNEVIKMTVNGQSCTSNPPPASGLPPLTPGTNATVTVHCVVPDTTPTSASTTFQASVLPDPAGDLNFADNTSQVSLATSDWCLVVANPAGSPCIGNGPGSSDGTPLTIVLAGSNNTTVQAEVIAGGASTPTVNLVPGVFSTGLAAPTIGSGVIAVNNGTSNITATVTNGNLANGIYLVQVIAQMTDGGTVTSRRQATIHVNESSSFASDTVTINSVPVNPPGPANTSPGSAVQINGALPVQLDLAVTRAGCSVGPCPGSADIHFTDTNSTQTAPLQMKGVPYGIAQSYQVTPTQDATGNVSAGPTIVVASATAVLTSTVRNPGPEPAGQSQNLYFNIGDITLTAPACVAVAPGGAPFALTATFQPSGGFNTVVSWQWVDANHNPVSASPLFFSVPGGSSSVSSSTPISLQVTNTSNGVDGLQVYYLAATVSNSIASATKYFPVPFDASQGQNFCGAPFSAHTVRGSWSRSGGPVLPGGVGRANAARTTTGGPLPDLQLSSSNLSFTPSIPKQGDTIQVRFQIFNAGTADALQVPIALQVNGATVVSDTFDVPAGKTTLAGLAWASGDAGSHVAATAKNAHVTEATATPSAGPLTLLNAALVIDPQHVTAQKTTIGKSVLLSRLSVQPATASTLVAPAASAAQRILIQLDEGTCMGLRVTTGGTGPCGSADLEVTAADIGKGSFLLAGANGIADAGVSLSAARVISAFSSQVLAQAGHVYAVQLASGKIGYVTVQSIRNPSQLDAKTRALFRQTAIRLAASLGGNGSGPAAPGDIAGNGPRATVYIQLVLQAP